MLGQARYFKEPYEMPMALGARPLVLLLLQSACDVKQTIHLTSPYSSSPSSRPSLPSQIHKKLANRWIDSNWVQSNILKLDLIFQFLSSQFQGVCSLIRKENSYRNFRRRLRVRLRYRTLPREEHFPMPCSGIFTRFPFDRRQAKISLRKYQV